MTEGESRKTREGEEAKALPVARTLPAGLDLDVADAQALRETVVWQQRRFDAVIEIGRALGRTLDLDTVLQIIMEQVTILMNADRSTLFLLDREAGELWSMVAQGVEIKEIRMPADKGLAGWVAHEGEAVNIPDAYADDRFNQAVDRETGYRTESILTVPVFDRRHAVLGVVQCLNKRGGPFTAQDEALAASLVAQAAVSLENSQLYRDLMMRNQALLDAQAALEHKVDEMDLLYEVERSISAAAGLEETLETLLRMCCQVIRAEAASVMLLEEASGEFYFKAASGPSAKALRRVRIGLDRGIAGMVARLGIPRIVNDVRQDPHHDDTIDAQVDFETHSLLAAPLRARGKVIGAIEVLNHQDRAGFTEDDLKLLELIAGQASRAIAIRRAREAEEKAERLSLLGQMMGGILHDLKTPMTVISGHAQLMAMEDNQAKRDTHCEALLSQFDNINAMTREILAFAKGKREILVRRVFLNRFIDDVRELLQPELDRHQIILKIIDGYRGVARFDEGKMKRVVTNIARNACEAMDVGGTFTWEIRRIDDDLVFRFIDTGPGIPPEMEGRLFVSFATHGKRSGTGLGLAIVHKIVQEHGGEITYSTEEGRGTTFTLKLPLAGEEHA